MNVNDLLTDIQLQNEIGYEEIPSGGWLVAMKSEMPHVTGDMIDWWFWWHVQESLRYKIWFPGEHYGNSTAIEDKEYFSSPFNGFKPNTQYPIEKIGHVNAKLFIQFVSPEQFGFDTALFKDNDIATIVCGYVGLSKFNLEHTKMVHIFKQTTNGLTIISRFWLGDRLKLRKLKENGFLNSFINSSAIKKRIFKKELAYGMAEHCSKEYRNLSRILPDLYKNYGE